MNGLNQKQRRNSLWQLVGFYVLGLLLTVFFLWKMKNTAVQSRNSNKESSGRFDKEKVFLDLAHASLILDTLVAEEMKYSLVLYVPTTEQKIDYQHFKDVLFAAYRIKKVDSIYYDALLGVFQAQEIAYQNIRFLKQVHLNKRSSDSLTTQLENYQQQVHVYKRLYNDCCNRRPNQHISK